MDTYRSLNRKQGLLDSYVFFFTNLSVSVMSYYNRRFMLSTKKKKPKPHLASTITFHITAASTVCLQSHTYIVSNNSCSLSSIPAFSARLGGVACLRKQKAQDAVQRCHKK